MPSTTKLYAGAKLREIRVRLALTQARYAAKLGISTSYLNQMENNHRPVSARTVLALATEFGVHVAELAEGASEQILADMREALADPVFQDGLPLGDLQLVASNAPNFAHAFLTLYRAHRQVQEQLAQFDEALGAQTTSLAPQPWEEVRNFFHYRDNYIDSIDRAAEAFADSIDPSTRMAALAHWLESRRGVTLAAETGGPLRRFQPDPRRLTVAAESPVSTQPSRRSTRLP